MTTSLVHREALMGTVVEFRVPLRGRARAECVAAVERGVRWFRDVEAVCSRFDVESEVARISAQPGVAVSTSPLLFEATRFALALAEESGGAFDPTIGAALEARGFNVEYRSGREVRVASHVEAASYRDVHLDAENHAITLDRPLLLDLGAVAKGLAVDLAARELQPLGDFLINAGGDVYAGGVNERGEPWSVGVQHPFDDAAVIETFRVSDAAVCTSGNYARRGPGGVTHIVDARSGADTGALASATVVASSAMVADGLSTAAFILGLDAGAELLSRQGVRGLLVATNLDRIAVA